MGINDYSYDILIFEYYIYARVSVNIMNGRATTRRKCALD